MFDVCECASGPSSALPYLTHIYPCDKAGGIDIIDMEKISVESPNPQLRFPFFFFFFASFVLDRDYGNINWWNTISNAGETQSEVVFGKCRVSCRCAIECSLCWSSLLLLLAAMSDINLDGCIRYTY